jgi:hypothetical protein
MEPTYSGKCWLIMKPQNRGASQLEGKYLGVSAQDEYMIQMGPRTLFGVQLPPIVLKVPKANVSYVAHEIHPDYAAAEAAASK